MKIVVCNRLTLDGVMQAPGNPDEDTRGGFTHGGWANRYSDDALNAEMGKGIGQAGGMLFGRRTYEQFASVWPHMPADNQYAAALNSLDKYVVSRTLTETPSWQNTTLLRGEAVESVAELKRRPGKDLVILGSGALVQTLARHGLIDEYVLLIHPLVLGSGRRMFRESGTPTELTLTNSVTTTSGVVIATYQPA